MANTETVKILQEEPYVKVATREIAILVQEVQNSQKEKRDLKERCLNLEKYISTMRPSTIRAGTESRVYSDESETQPAFFPPTFNLTPYSKPTFNASDLEEDSVSIPEVFAEPDSSLFRGQQRCTIVTTQRNMVFQYPQVHGTSSSESDLVPPVLLTKYPEQIETKNKFYGVSEDSFNMALKELAKCKKSNAELTKMTENAPKNSSEWHNLEEKVRQVEAEKAALHNKIKCLERNVTDEAQTEIINILQKKIFQQKRQSSLRDLAFDQLNKQCDKWRNKYEEMSNQFGQLFQQIHSQQFEVVRDAPLFGDELSEISTSPSAPNFDQLLHVNDSYETDVVMHDQVEGDPLNHNKSEKSERGTENNADVNMFVQKVNINISGENKQDTLDNFSDIDNVPETHTTSSTVHEFLRNLNARNNVSTQMDSRVFGRDKYVQTDDNNNSVIDEQTQTEQTVVNSGMNNNVCSTDMVLDLTMQNDLLNERYECMRGENTVLKSGLDDKDNSSVAEELANRMKQLNLHFFSVYKDKDSLRNMIQSEYEDFRREYPGRGLNSMPSTISETKPRHTIKLNSRQITVLSDLSAADFINLNNTSGVFPREYNSCPDL